jgi:hypothetical protein
MVGILKFIFFLAITWPSVVSVPLKCDLGFGETVVKLLNSRPDHQPFRVSLVNFRTDDCILDDFEMIVNKVERKKEYTFNIIDGLKITKVSKPKSHITIMSANDSVSI